MWRRPKQHEGKKEEAEEEDLKKRSRQSTDSSWETPRPFAPNSQTQEDASAGPAALRSEARLQEAAVHLRAEADGRGAREDWVTSCSLHGGVGDCGL